MQSSEYRDPDGSFVLALTGEVDLAEAPAVRGAGLAALGRSDVAALRIDLSAVTFMDSSGLGALIHINHSAPGRVRLIRPSARVTRLIELAGLTGTFVIESTDESAGINNGPRRVPNPG